MEALQMENAAAAEGAVEEWQEGMEAAGPVPLQALEVRNDHHPNVYDTR